MPQDIKSILTAIRACRGAVYVGVLARNDVFYIKCVKSDLIARIMQMSDGEIEVSECNGALYIDSAS